MSRWLVLVGLLFGTGCLGNPEIPEVFITPVDPTTTDDLVANAVGGDIESFTYKWFQGDSARSDLQSATVSASETSKGEEWRVVAYQAGGSGWESGTRTVTVLNTAPVLNELVLEPEVGNATTEDNVQATLDVSDADEDSLEITWAWSKDGVLQESLETDALDSALTSRGDTWTVTATVSDGEADPLVESLEFPIGNVLPVVSDVRILVEETGLAEDFRTGTDLTATWSVEDADGDAVSVDVDWTVNGTSVQDGDNATLSSDFFVRGDEVGVTVTPHDGWGYGNSMVGDAVTIVNTPPSVGSVSIDPTVIYTDTPVTCWALDLDEPDGDAVTYNWSISAGGTPILSDSTTTNSLEIDPSRFVKHDELDCTVIVNDGIEDGDGVGTGGGVVVLNSVPAGGSAAIAAEGGVSPITTGVNLLATVTLPTDADGDVLQVGYEWRTAGVGSIPGAGGQGTLDGGLTSRGDEVYLRLNVTDLDTVDEGDIDVTSNFITIENSPPTWDGFLVNGQSSAGWGPVYTDTDLVLTEANSQDADGDVTTYEWTLWNDQNGDGSADSSELTEVTGAASGHTFSSSLFSKGDTIALYGEVSDGTDTVGLHSSVQVVVSNTPPDLGGITIDPNPAFATDTVSWVPGNATEADQDPDGDTLQYTVEWQVNGTTVGRSETQDLSSWGRDDVVSVSVTPNDGEEDGTLESAILVISDSPPEVTSVTISPSTAFTNDILTASAVTNDPDGDGVVLFMNWTVNGGDVLYGENAQLDGSTEFDRDEVITVTVTPFNTALTLAGTPVTSSALTVSTPPPTAPQLTIDPLEPLAGIDDLLCEVDVPSVDDDDNDAISYTMTWTVDGAPFTTPLTHTWPGDAIAAADTSEGETWVCTATPSDGTDTGPIATTSVTILKSFSGWIPAAQALSQADHIFNGDYPNDSMGWDVAFVGDVDGGGTEDILIGQPDGNYLGSGEVGTSHLFLGENLSMASYDAADADYIFGSASWCEWGYGAQPAGDIDGDGYADLIIAGPTCDVIGVTDNGLVAIISASEFLGSTSAPNIDILLESNAWVFYGEESYAFLGRGRSQNSNNSNNNTNQSLHGGLDVSGDGTPDVIFGTNIKNVRQGVTYVVLGENLGVAGTWESAGNSDYIISGVDGDSGIEVELVPDVDGDGFAEFMIGAPKCQASPRGGFIGNSNSAGAAYLFFGGDLASPGARQLGVATDSNVYFTGKGNYGGGLFGQSVAGVEDMDGDGYAEVAVGAPWADLAGSHSGGVFLYSASQVQAEDYFAGNGGQIDSANASWTLEGKTGDHELGADMSTAGDVDNDGLGDLIIGVESDSTGTHPLGGSYLAMGADLVANGSSAMDFTTWATYRFKEPTQDNHAYQVDGGADFNQDGLDDLLIGARFYDSNGQTDAGAAFLFLAP